jgi:hypothetical protein
VALGEPTIVCFANFFAACFVASNFCQSNEFGVELCTAGFCFWSDFSCPFNCRREKGAVIRGAINSVSTNKTAPKKNRTPVISKNVRRRGQRFPSGSEKTNGVTQGGTFSGICRLICLDYEEVRTRNKLVIQSENANPARIEGSRCAHEVMHFPRSNPVSVMPASTPG